MASPQAPSNEKAAEAAERYRVLLEINNAIITNLTQDTLLHAICTALEKVIHYNRAGLTLYEPEGDVLRFVSLEGQFQSDYYKLGFTLDRKDSHSGWAFDHHKPLLRRDLEAEWQYSSEEILVREGIKSLCTAPMLVRGRCIGTLNVASETRFQYSEVDAEFLGQVAKQVALAVENMKAYEEIAALKARLEAENIYLQEEIRREHNFEEMVGTSPALLELLRKVEMVAPTDSTVLICGETGTGKELIARALHDRSSRRDRPLVKVNCGAIPAGLVESELFGHVKGAFTGALENSAGRFQLADGGTLFLDEVGELPPETQVKLLRVLQEQEFEPVGSRQTIRVNVRILAATNRDLEEAVLTGRFRSDLFYRLNVLQLNIPPLHERRSDIPHLAVYFLERFSQRFGKKMQGISQETMDLLVAYSWPGNVRELQNVIERGVVLSQSPILTLDRDLLPARPPQADSVSKTMPGDAAVSASSLSLEEIEKRHILAVLRETGGVIEGAKGAAKILGLHPNTLRSRMKKLGIQRSSHEVS